VGKHRIHPDQETVLELPYSEVCMHLRVAGSRTRARLVADGMVQLLDGDGREFSFPITAAEAGLDLDQDGWFSVVADPPDPPADPPTPDQGQRAIIDTNSQLLAGPDRPTWRGEVIGGPSGPAWWHPQLGDLPVPDPEQQP
jgi:hypothetical protein